MNGTYFRIMKHLLLTMIAAVVLVGGGAAVTKTAASTLAYEVSLDIPW